LPNADWADENNIINKFLFRESSAVAFGKEQRSKEVIIDERGHLQIS